MKSKINQLKNFFRYPLYTISGAAIGLIAGVFFGLTFDSFYTKKSEFETKTGIQMAIFGGLGMALGIAGGLTAAHQVQKEEAEKKRYQLSLISRNCIHCNEQFIFSNLEYVEKEYCDKCILNIKFEYQLALTKYNKAVKGIEDLKMRSAIEKRIILARDAIVPIVKYDKIKLPFIDPKPTDILLRLDTFFDSQDIPNKKLKN